MSNLRKFWVLALALAAALMIPAGGLLAAQAGQPTAPGRQLFSPEVLGQMRTLVEEGKLDLKNLPKVDFQLPVTRMVEEQLTLAGVKVAPHSLESICYENVYWNGGPTVASATDGRVTVWGSQLGLYFAKASDTSHPVTFSFGDVPIKIYIHGNQVFVHGLWYSYTFDVSDPANPKFGSLLTIGAWQGYRAFAWTPDGTKIVAINEDWLYGGFGPTSVIVFDASTFSSVGSVMPAGFSGNTAFSDVVVPADPGTVAVVSGGAIPDPTKRGTPLQKLYFIDLIPPPCATPQPSLNVLGTITCTGHNTGALLAVGQTLYVNSRPFWSYNPTLDGWFYAGYGVPLPPPAQGMTVDVYNVPDFAQPATATLTGTYTRSGDDPVTWYATSQGNVVLGTYQDHVLQMPAGLGDPTTTVTLGDYAGSGGTQVMQDLGWDAASGKGVGACNNRGARFFTSLSGPETGHFWTGDTSQNPVLEGNYLYVPQGAGGLAVVDVTNAMSPVQAGAVEGVATTLLAFSADGYTAYATDGTAKVWALNTLDKTHPTVIAGTTYTPGAAVTALACTGHTLFVGTTAGVEVVDYTAATAPVLLKSLPAAGSSGVKALKVFVHPDFPQDTFLVTAEGNAVQLLDVTGPGNPAGYQYYAVASQTFAPYGDNVSSGIVGINYIATNGAYIYALDAVPVDYNQNILPTAYLRPIYAQPNPGVFPGVITLTTAGTTPFLTSSKTANNPSYEGWVGLENVQPGILVTGTDSGAAIGTLDVGTNPAAPTFAPPTTWAFPRFLTNNGYAILNGFAAGNGWIWAAGGEYGVMGVSVQPGWQDMQITSVDATPKYTYPGAATGRYLLQGVTTFSATIKTADAPCRMVQLYWGPVSETWVGEIPPNTTQTLTWTEDLDTLYGSAASSACGSGRVINAQAETTDMANCSIAATKTGAEYYRTNVPPPSFSVYNMTPPIPASNPCTGGGGIGSWAVCSPISFNIRWNDCSSNINGQGQTASGITRVALYVDAQLATAIDNPPSAYPGPKFTIDPVALGLSDGGHSFFTVATNKIGKTSQSTEYPFIVHTRGPAVAMTAPTGGNVITGRSLRVAATATSSAGMAIQWVRFFLDVDPSDPALVTGANLLPSSGVDLGTATAADGFGQYSVTWNATMAANGPHTLYAFSSDSLSTESCKYITFSPAAPITLVPYVTPTVSVGVAPASGNQPLTVTFTATVSGGVGPFAYAWDFGDSSTSTANPATHIYGAAGRYSWNLTVTDSRGGMAIAGAIMTVYEPPVLLSVTKAQDPFRLILRGTKFQSGCVVKIDGTAAAGALVYKGSTEIVVKGESLKNQLPKSTAVSITVVNPDGAVSNAVSFTR